MYSRKLSWGWLRVQFVAGFNWVKRRPTLDYRCGCVWQQAWAAWAKLYWGPSVSQTQTIGMEGLEYMFTLCM